MAEPDEPELVPPSAERVAKRALVLTAVVCRSGIEDAAGDGEAEAFRRRVVRWLEDVGLAEELEPDEAQVLQLPLGALSERQRINASWRGEGGAVLAWALGRFGLPPYDQMVHAPDVGSALGFLESDGQQLLANPRVRSRQEIGTYAQRMFTVHWRLRQFSQDHLPMDFEAFARTCWFGPLETQGVQFVTGDLAVGGVPISAATESAFEECRGIVVERHKAANWLTGQHPVYREVTTDT